MSRDAGRGDEVIGDDVIGDDEKSGSDIVLINAYCGQRPGITAALTRIMASYQLEILDIGQAVIHNAATLAIVARLSDDKNAVLKDLLFRAHEMGISLQFDLLTREEYNRWQAGRHSVRYIVTLLARILTAEQVARISTIVTERNLVIDRVRRLSERRHLEEVPGTSRACVEFVVSGDAGNLPDVRAALLQLAGELDVDIAFQVDDVFRRNRRMVAFDMDSTLIQAEVIDELARAAGVFEQVAGITTAAMQGEIDFSESLRRRVALLKGLDASVLETVSERLPLTEGAERLISTLKNFGYKTAILSGGFGFFARQLQARLGIDYVYANEIEIVDGKVTGKVLGTIVDGQRKAHLLQTIADREGLRLEQVIAVGDGANDLPMLSIAGMGVAFHAKPLVRQEAQHQISTLGLDGILYLLGFTDRDTALTA